MEISQPFRAIGKVFSDLKLLKQALLIKLQFSPYFISFKHYRYVKELRKRDHVNVVFLPMNVAMWKYQHVYELFKSDKRFHVYIFLSPTASFPKNQRIEDLKAMRAYFAERNMEYVDYELEMNKPIVGIRSVVEPDILFYTQPYIGAVDENRRFVHFFDKLLCYAPYAFLPRNVDSLFKNPLTESAWRFYYQTESNRKHALSLDRIITRNGKVAGYTSADDYFTPMKNDVWKEKEHNKKRVIWAPHFTIIEGEGYFHASYFLEMASFMQELAIEYADRIAFAFKPHPRLFSDLCRHPNWGTQKTKEYYAFWENNENTQLETGDFIDLFKGSDAMIHDCGSFTVDYLYFGKPVLYDNPNIEDVKTTADELGKQAYDAHYRVKTLSDIKAFIDEVVLDGNDTMLPVRKKFFDSYVQPKDGKTASQFIYDDIVKSIWGKNSCPP